MSWCTCHLTSWPIKGAQQVITFASKCGTINCRCIKDFDWSYQSTNRRIVFFTGRFTVLCLTLTLTVVHNKKSSSVLAYQDGRVVKALDLSSNGGIPAWVRTSLLVIFFIFSFHQRPTNDFSQSEIRIDTEKEKCPIWIKLKFLREISQNNEEMTQIQENG